MLLAHDGVDLAYDECIGVTYDDVRHDPDAALATIVERYKAVEAQCDAVVIVGSDYTDVGSPAELGLQRPDRRQPRRPRAARARRPRAQGQGEQLGTTHRAHARRDGADRRRSRSPSSRTAAPSLLAVVANRADPDDLDEIVASIQRRRSTPPQAAGPRDRSVPVWALPEDRFLVAPSVRGVMRSVEGTPRQGRPRAADPRGARRRRRGHVDGQRAAAPHRERDRRRSRPTAPRCCSRRCSPNASGTFPSLAGIVLNGPFPLPDDDRPPDRRARARRCRSSRPTSARTRRRCAS